MSLDLVDIFRNAESRFYDPAFLDTSFKCGVLHFWGKTIRCSNLSEIFQWIVDTIDRRVNEEGEIEYRIREVDRDNKDFPITYEDMPFTLLKHTLEAVKCTYIDYRGLESEKSLWFIVGPLLMFLKTSNKFNDE